MHRELPAQFSRHETTSRNDADFQLGSGRMVQISARSAGRIGKTYFVVKGHRTLIN